MPVETVTIESGGDQVAGELTRPATDTDHAAVLLPGANHGPYGDVFDRLAEAAAAHGVAFLRYEGWEDGDHLQAKPIEDVHADLDAAVDFLADRGYARITLVGKSAGGGIALGHVPDPVDDLILWAPAVFLEGGSAVERLDVPESASPPTVTPDRLGAIERPVAILQGDQDHFPVANARELADALPDGSVTVIEGADHSFTGAGEDETVATTVELLDRPVGR